MNDIATLTAARLFGRSSKPGGLRAQSSRSLAAVLIWCAAGAGCYSTTQAFLSQRFGESRAAAISWNNSSMNAGVAFGTALLGVLPAGGLGFSLVATALALAGIAAAVAARLQERGACAGGPCSSA